MSNIFAHLMQQPAKLMTCTMIPSKRLGCLPRLKDEEHFVYTKKSENKTSKFLDCIFVIFFSIYFVTLICLKRFYNTLIVSM